MLVQAWSPRGRGARIRHPTLISIAEAHVISPAQVALRWSIQRGLMPIPKATELHHQRENLEVFDFELTPEARNEHTNLPQAAFSGLHPDTVTF